MRNRLPALVAVGALVVLAGVVARGSSAVPLGQTKPLFGWLRLPDFLKFNVGDEPEATRPPRHDATWVLVIDWIILLLPLIVLVVLIALAVIIDLRRRRFEVPRPVRTRPPAPGVADDRSAALLRAARAAERVLADHEGGPPGDAVIAAWLELERVAEQADHARRPYQTPTEFTEELLAEHAAIQTAVERLRALYHRARFGRSGEVGPAEAEAARRALSDITHSLVAR